MVRLIDLERLNKIFGDGTNNKQFDVKCSCRGCDVQIIITRTSGGFGFQGGVLYETDTGQYLAKCTHCYNADIGFVESQPKSAALKDLVCNDLIIKRVLAT